MDEQNLVVNPRIKEIDQWKGRILVKPSAKIPLKRLVFLESFLASNTNLFFCLEINREKGKTKYLSFNQHFD